MKAACIFRSETGVSLVEMLVVVFIVSIMTAVVTPSFGEFFEGQRLRHFTLTLAESMSHARMSAISRADTVVLVPADGDWSKGWSVFVDNDGDLQPGPADEILARQGAVSADIKILMGFSMPDREGYIAYGPSGRSCRAGAPELPRFGTLTIAGAEQKRRIKVNLIGRHRVCNPLVEKVGCDGPDP